MLTANSQVGDYRVTRQIGEGGLGAVFEAVHRVHPDVRAAIKVLHAGLGNDPELAARFRHEAEATQLIKHPGVVKVHDFMYLEDRSTCIVMEYLEGESLQQRLNRVQGLLPLAEALFIHEQIAAVLTVAHAQGITHRDLKPGNVMLISGSDGSPRVKVLDFGIAKVATQDFTQLGTADGKSVMGTLAFMSPEQFMTPSRVNGQADVYSLGVMLHWALSGNLPFESPEAGQAAQLYAYYVMHSEGVPPTLPAGTPAEVAQLVSQMLAKTPAERPTMAQVATRLNELGARPSARIGLPPARPPVCTTKPKHNSASNAGAQATWVVRPASSDVSRLKRWPLAVLFLSCALLVGTCIAVLLLGGIWP